MKWCNALVLRRTLVGVLAAVGLCFIVYLTWKYQAEMSRLLVSVDVKTAALALAALLVCNLGVALVFSGLAQAEMSTRNGKKIQLVSIFFLSQVAKYVPGRIWGPVLQGVAVGPALSLQSLVRINIDIALMAAMVTLGAALAFIGWAAWGGMVSVLLLLATILSASAMMKHRPSIRLHALLGRITPRLSAAEPTRKPDPTIGVDPTGLVGIVLFVLGYCSGWLLLVVAVVGGALTEGMRLTSMLSFSYLAGLVSMLPAGLGVREAFFVAASAWMELDMAAVTLLAIVTRLAMVVVDLLMLPIAGILFLSTRRT